MTTAITAGSIKSRPKPADRRPFGKGASVFSRERWAPYGDYDNDNECPYLGDLCVLCEIKNRGRKSEVRGRKSEIGRRKNNLF